MVGACPFVGNTFELRLPLLLVKPQERSSVQTLEIARGLTIAPRYTTLHESLQTKYSGNPIRQLSLLVGQISRNTEPWGQNLNFQCGPSVRMDNIAGVFLVMAHNLR